MSRSLGAAYRGSPDIDRVDFLLFSLWAGDCGAGSRGSGAPVCEAAAREFADGDDLLLLKFRRDWLLESGVEIRYDVRGR